MSIDLLGPASTNAVTSRPSSTTTYGTEDTWMKPCSSAAAQDGTQITADWLNLILAQFRDAIVGAGIVQDNGDDMLWRVFKVMASRQAADTGAANALVITDTPPIPALRPGMVLLVKVRYGNTTASTIAWDGQTAVPIVNWVDGSALAAGALVASGYHLLIGDDVGNMRLINSGLSGGGGGGGGSSGGGFAGQARGLIGSAVGATKTASWTAQELSAEVTAGGTSYKGAAQTLNFNGATTGANGMDTSTPPASGDLSIYAIYDPTSTTWATLGCAASTSAGLTYTGENMPSGYTASGLIWSGKTDSSGNINAFNQLDRLIEVLAPVNYSGGGGWNGYWPGVSGSTFASSLASVSLASAVPANAKAVRGDLALVPAAGDEFPSFGAVASTATGIGAQIFGNSGSGAVIAGRFDDIEMVTAQTVYLTSVAGGVFDYNSGGGSNGALPLIVTGYKI